MLAGFDSPAFRSCFLSNRRTASVIVAERLQSFPVATVSTRDINADGTLTLTTTVGPSALCFLPEPVRFPPRFVSAISESPEKFTVFQLTHPTKLL